MILTGLLLSGSSELVVAGAFGAGAGKEKQKEKENKINVCQSFNAFLCKG